MGDLEAALKGKLDAEKKAADLWQVNLQYQASLKALSTALEEESRKRRSIESRELQHLKQFQKVKQSLSQLKPIQQQLSHLQKKFSLQGNEDKAPSQQERERRKEREKEKEGKEREKEKEGKGEGEQVYDDVKALSTGLLEGLKTISSILQAMEEKSDEETKRMEKNHEDMESLKTQVNSLQELYALKVEEVTNFTSKNEYLRSELASVMRDREILCYVLKSLARRLGVSCESTSLFSPSVGMSFDKGTVTGIQQAVERLQQENVSLRQNHEIDASERKRLQFVAESLAKEKAELEKTVIQQNRQILQAGFSKQFPSKRQRGNKSIIQPTPRKRRVNSRVPHSEPCITKLARKEESETENKEAASGSRKEFPILLISSQDSHSSISQSVDESRGENEDVNPNQESGTQSDESKRNKENVNPNQATKSLPLREKGKQTTSFAFQEVVRKKDDRQALPAHSCQDCERFLRAISGDGNDHEKARLLHKCSRHRSKTTAPMTPEGYWSLPTLHSSPPSSQESLLSQP